jgi:peptidyl-prolyl cis-trans isomerase D
MLQIIRDRAQGIIVWTIVGLVIITFALFGLGSYLSGSSSNNVASVNGENISQNDFQRAYQNYQNRLRQMLGENYRSDLFKPAAVKQEVLNGIINQRLMSQYLEEQKIFTADQVVAETLSNIPAFKDEQGKFSQERYHELLRRQGLSPIGFEADLARDIAAQEVSDALTRTAFVTPKELALYQRLKHQQRKVGYLLFKKATYLANTSIDDAAIEKYYQAHQDMYKTPEMVKLNYVELDLAKRSANIDIDEAKIKAYYRDNRANYAKTQEQRKASHILIKVNKDMDDASAKAKLNEILNEYKAGKPFAELAKQYSQDPGSAKQGGDLGFFGRGVMDKAFEEAAFSLKKGEVSQPVKSRFGYHLILVTDIKPAVYRPYAEVKDQIKHRLQMAAAEQDFYVDAEKLDNLSYEIPDNLNTVVDELGLKLQQSDFITRGGGKGLMANPKIIEAAFSDDVLNQHRNSSLIEISSTHLVVLRLAEHKPSQLKPLAEVKDDITKRLRDQAAQHQASQDAEVALKAMREGTDAKQWSQENHKGEWQSSGYIGRSVELDPDAADKKVTIAPELRKQAFAMTQPKDSKAVADVVNLSNGDAAVLLLYEVKDVDIKEAMTKQYQQQLQSAMGQENYNAFMQALRADADISIQTENIQE